MLPILILTAILASVTYPLANYRNYVLRERRSGISPCMPNTPMPMKHKISYVLDWLLTILIVGLLGFMVWMVLNSIN